MTQAVVADTISKYSSPVLKRNCSTASFIRSSNTGNTAHFRDPELVGRSDHLIITFPESSADAKYFSETDHENLMTDDVDE